MLKSNSSLQKFQSINSQSLSLVIDGKKHGFWWTCGDAVGSFLSGLIN
ncbi:hypothetical protein [Bombilactobacillus thymidiniphilus]|uniref:Uncharacterized protein n=1 Tax=Bombilactobacillus thymidiniphilus TaxID=2923363 RepID=A0ABY4PEE3_9LACO|nr:hypothetical protein [Bombilactobacillus thymidiniphilus]UQS83595.1 hypothetical protein MOO47_07475 [Bombilactobacillus thymidiniphilus]UQS83652.1 hypothetical protein MOO47_00155 [Bombilactobacillus thymidiniphilus]